LRLVRPRKGGTGEITCQGPGEKKHGPAGEMGFFFLAKVRNAGQKKKCREGREVAKILQGVTSSATSKPGINKREGTYLSCPKGREGENTAFEGFLVVFLK